MRLLAISLLFGLGSCGTHKPVPPPPTNVASAPALKAATAEQQSKASAAVEAATVSNQSAQESPAKTATAGELSVAAANLPAPAEKDKAEALARVNAALTGDLKTANEGWAKARNDASALMARVAQLEATVESERVKAAAELQRQLQQARDEAEQKAKAKERTMLTLIFFGGGALLLAGATAILFLGASVPIFGPKAAIAVGGAGLALILTGTLIRAINNFIEAHPYIFWSSTLLALVGTAVAVALMVANHHHHVEQKAQQ